jgi:hypothetical protein
MRQGSLHALSSACTSAVGNVWVCPPRGVSTTDACETQEVKAEPAPHSCLHIRRHMFSSSKARRCQRNVRNQHQSTLDKLFIQQPKQGWAKQDAHD